MIQLYIQPYCHTAESSMVRTPLSDSSSTRFAQRGGWEGRNPCNTKIAASFLHRICVVRFQTQRRCCDDARAYPEVPNCSIPQYTLVIGPRMS